MKRQKTDWGYIDWLEEDMDESRASLNVGIVSIAPHGHMNPHIHFTEQVLYTMQGTGYSLVDGKKIDMSQTGMILHWEASVIHEMYNEGDMEFKHLMVSCPDTVGFDAVAFTDNIEERLAPKETEEYLRAAVNGTCEQFLNTIHYSYVIFNQIGMPVKKTHIFPQFCCQHCMEEIATDRAACMRHYIFCPFTEEGSFECPYGVTVFYVPVLYRGNFLGYVQGGYAHTRDTAQEGVYIMPESSIQGAKLLLGHIAKAMSDYCEVYRFKDQLEQQELVLEDTRQYQEILIANLHHAENTVTDLKINNHFLFNTLNQMASMALTGGMPSLYQSILDLSCLFSYGVKNQSSYVSLSDEFTHMDAYLKLQKLRYKENLQLTYDIQVDLAAWDVPFNFLIPVVENAFTHGFFQEDEKDFFFGIEERDGFLIFSVKNNGDSITAAVCHKLMEDMKHSASHGLSMVYRKLQALYRKDFDILIIPGTPSGLEVVITIPVKHSNEEGSHAPCGNMR